MKIETGMQPYPGDGASVEELLLLADTYAVAAHCLNAVATRKSFDHLPVRFNAIHAIELYLSAYLMLNGLSATETRSFSHNLARRADRAAEQGLILRKATRIHLQDLCEARDHLVTRYGPELAKRLCPPTRMMATLNEVRLKVRKAAQAPK